MTIQVAGSAQLEVLGVALGDPQLTSDLPVGTRLLPGGSQPTPEL